MISLDQINDTPVKLNVLHELDIQRMFNKISDVETKMATMVKDLNKISDVETKMVIMMKDLNRVTKKFDRKIKDLSNQITYIETHGSASFEKIENAICAYMVFNFAFSIIIFCVCYGLLRI